MFPHGNAKLREPTTYSALALHTTFRRLVIAKVGMGLGVRFILVRASLCEKKHDERFIETGTRLEPDRAAHRIGNYGYCRCIGRAELSDIDDKGSGA
jgi:hypothetical protein